MKLKATKIALLFLVLSTLSIACGQAQAEESESLANSKSMRAVESVFIDNSAIIKPEGQLLLDFTVKLVTRFR